MTVFCAGLPTVSICTSQGVNLLMACTAYATKHSKNWTVDRLLNESPVRELLGFERVITEADPYEFQRKVRFWIYSSKC